MIAVMDMVSSPIRCLMKATQAYGPKINRMEQGFTHSRMERERKDSTKEVSSSLRFSSLVDFLYMMLFWIKISLDY